MPTVFDELDPFLQAEGVMPLAGTREELFGLGVAAMSSSKHQLERGSLSDNLIDPFRDPDDMDVIIKSTKGYCMVANLNWRDM
ncbi:hypothetical protein IAR50_002062 [Cryptococcus sp. DSM 104548]